MGNWSTKGSWRSDGYVRRTQFRWKWTKEKWHQKVVLITNTHVTLLHPLLLLTDSLHTSKCWWHINMNIHTVGLSPVDLAGKLLPPGGTRNEKLQRATLNSAGQPSRTSCTRFAPPWRHHWRAGRRTSPPWRPGCPLIRKKGWCCWEETRQEWVGFYSCGFRRDVQLHVLGYGGNASPGQRCACQNEKQSSFSHGCVVTFPARCRLRWPNQGWCRTCSRSQTPRTCACGRKWGCRRPAAAAAAPGWPCRPTGSPGGRGWGRSWTGPPSPPSAPGSWGSDGGRGEGAHAGLGKVAESSWQLSHRCFSFIPLTGEEMGEAWWNQFHHS